MRFPLLPGRSRTAGTADRLGSDPRKNIPFLGYVLPIGTTCAGSVAHTWNRLTISRAAVPTRLFFPRIYKNVYCSGTTIKLTILHKYTSVKGFSCVFSCFCVPLRQIFLSLSAHRRAPQNPAGIRRSFPPPDFSGHRFSREFRGSGRSSPPQPVSAREKAVHSRGISAFS